jgi:VWFA-related protein
MRIAWMAGAPALMTVVAAAAAGLQTPVEPRAPLHIQAVAVDRGGQPVTDLKPDEFEVWINVFRVPIQTVTIVTPASERPRSFVLLLDDMAIRVEDAPRVRDVARQFVKRLAPGDEAAVQPLNGAGIKPTTDREPLLRVIDRYNVRAVGVVPFDALGQQMLETYATLARQFSEVSGQKIVVGIGAGWLFDTPIPPPSVGRDLRKEWGETMRALALADVTLYVIDPGGVGTAPFATGGDSGFARETGGHAFLNTNDYAGAAERIMQQSANYYILDVADPPVGRKADLRELEVRVLRKGVTVRARKWIPGAR